MNDHPEKIALAYGSRLKIIALSVFAAPAIAVSLAAFLVFIPDKIVLAVGISIAAVAISGGAAGWIFKKRLRSFSCPVCGSVTMPISEEGEAAIFWHCPACQRKWWSGLARPINIV